MFDFAHVAQAVLVPPALDRVEHGYALVLGRHAGAEGVCHHGWEGPRHDDTVEFRTLEFGKPARAPAAIGGALDAKTRPVLGAGRGCCTGQARANFPALRRAGGGGSFGVFILFSSGPDAVPVLTDNQITRNAGGYGGDGGNAGTGGIAGEGAAKVTMPTALAGLATGTNTNGLRPRSTPSLGSSASVNASTA